ncbi:MAG TPA: hypothetical protein VN920_10660 [Pyrinomonadaceae bacterium]|nr:hypothetical protein [Pyrinomonadaceae bacterium]
MGIERKRFTISLVLLASLLLPSVTLAQGTTVPKHDWSALKTVTSGSKLVTKLKKGKKIEGKLTGVSDTTLSLTVKGKPLDVNRDDVLSIYQTSRKSTTQASLIGLGVGAGAGALIGVAGSREDHFEKLDHAFTAGLIVLGAGAGAVAGYFIGRTGRKRVLIYEAK